MSGLRHCASPLQTTSIHSYPPPSIRYPPLVFDHPGILHRNSCTKSRAIAPALVGTLKRRDRSCIGDDLGPESLGDEVTGPASARSSAGPTHGSWSKSPNQPSAVARHNF